MPDYDVVIAGGGMVGASLALALAAPGGKPLRVLIVERFAPTTRADHSPNGEPFPPGFDARSTALSHGSVQFLQQLQLFNALAGQATPITRIHVSDRGRPGSVILDAAKLKWPAMGQVVENAVLGNALMAAIRANQAIALQAPASVVSARVLSESVEVDLADDQRLACQLLVVADGADSALRRDLGIGQLQRHYQQAAVIANVCFSEPHRGRAYERFTEQGAMALLPLADSERGEPRAALVWTVPDTHSDELMVMPDADFLAQLQCNFGHRQGRFSRVGQRFHYPLHRQQAKEQIRRGIVLMGNAAHSLHPVAGQGFNLAVRDCVRLATELRQAHSAGSALGELPILQRYLAKQLPDQSKTIALSDRLIDLFGHRLPMLGMLPDLGLTAMDMLPAAKSVFVRHAAGLHDGAAITLPALEA